MRSLPLVVALCLLMLVPAFGQQRQDTEGRQTAEERERLQERAERLEAYRKETFPKVLSGHAGYMAYAHFAQYFARKAESLEEKVERARAARERQGRAEPYPVEREYEALKKQVALLQEMRELKFRYKYRERFQRKGHEVDEDEIRATFREKLSELQRLRQR